jgi:hypothetical protein
VGAKYDFNGLDEHRCLMAYAMNRIVLNRVLWSVDNILHGQAASSLDVEHEAFCRQVWMAFPYAHKVSLMTAIQLADPLYLSYEGARGETKEYLLTHILELTRYRARVPNDRELVHRYLIDTAHALTGRIPFHERKDFPYWKERSEVMTKPAGEISA